MTIVDFTLMLVLEIKPSLGWYIINACFPSVDIIYILTLNLLFTHTPGSKHVDTFNFTVKRLENLAQPFNHQNSTWSQHGKLESQYLLQWHCNSTALILDVNSLNLSGLSKKGYLNYFRDAASLRHGKGRALLWIWKDKRCSNRHHDRFVILLSISTAKHPLKE